MDNQQKRNAGLGVQQGKKRVHSKQMDFTQYDAEYVGTFKFHHPSVMERMQIGVLKAQMLQGLEGRVDVITDNIAHMSSTLEVVMEENPTWFVLSDISDYEILDGVYEEYVQWYNSFRKPNKKTENAGDSE